MSDQNQVSVETTPEQASSKQDGVMSKVFGYLGFGVGMILMLAFIPVSKSQAVNFVVGALVGGIGSGVGAWIGNRIDKLED